MSQDELTTRIIELVKSELPSESEITEYVIKYVKNYKGHFTPQRIFDEIDTIRPEIRYRFVFFFINRFSAPLCLSYFNEWIDRIYSSNDRLWGLSDYNTRRVLKWVFPNRFFNYKIEA